MYDSFMEKKKTDNSLDDVWFVYDGECPLCQIGAALYKLRQAVGQLHTVDARTQKDHPVMIEANQAGLNLDAGMVIKYRGQLYQGGAALHLMAQLGDKASVFNKVNNTVFQSKFLVTICYPFMRLARNIALMLKGAGKIRNLER